MRGNLYRSSPSPACREFLEQAYVGRIQQLAQTRQMDDARHTFDRLVEMKPVSAEAQRAIPRLAVMVGSATADVEAAFAEDPALLVEQTDAAVLDARVPAPSQGSIPLHVTCVRDAFDAVEAGDDERATSVLREIPRSSPLVDWKLFLRGLVAFYDGDSQRVQANWERLSADRPAFRIAQTLLVASGKLPSGETAIDVAGGVARLEKSLGGDRADELVRQLADDWRAGEVDDFTRSYRRLCQRYRESHAELIAAVTEVAWKAAVRSGDGDLLLDLEEIGPPPALDPHWHRAWALFWEAQLGEAETAIDRWQLYVGDIGGLESLTSTQQAIATALAYQHLARLCVETAERANPWSPPTADTERASAAEFYRSAIEAYPELVSAYRELSLVCFRTGDQAGFERALKDLLAQFPNDFDAHFDLAESYVKQELPVEAKPYVDGLRRLRPRDPATLILAWNQRVSMVRCLAKAGKLDAARQECELLAEVEIPDVEPYALDTLRAGLELKAQNRDLAERYLAAAVSKTDEPAAVWMRMGFTAARFGLPVKVRGEFNKRCKEAVQGVPSSRTAGELARFLRSNLLGHVDYVGRGTHEKLFAGYVKRARDMTWRESDLVDVCRYLNESDGGPRLQQDLLSRGLQKFPGNPRLYLWMAELKMQNPPTPDLVAIVEDLLGAALQLAHDCEPVDGDLVERIQTRLSVVEQLQEDFYDRYDDPSRFYYGADDEEDDDYGGSDSFGVEPGYVPGYVPEGIGRDSEELDAIVAEGMKQLPASMLAQLKQIAKMTGMSIKEVMKEILTSGPELELPGLPTPNSARANSTRRKRKTRH